MIDQMSPTMDLSLETSPRKNYGQPRPVAEYPRLHETRSSSLDCCEHELLLLHLARFDVRMLKSLVSICETSPPGLSPLDHVLDRYCSLSSSGMQLILRRDGISPKPCPTWAWRCCQFYSHTVAAELYSARYRYTVPAPISENYRVKHTVLRTVMSFFYT